MSSWTILESLSEVSQFDRVEELRLAVEQVNELLPKRPPLHDVPFEGGNINLGGLDHFLKWCWCECLEQSSDLETHVEDRL